MENRRGFIKNALIGIGVALIPVSYPFRVVLGAIKKVILPQGTDPKSLKTRYPATLDTRNLDITPIEWFDTMGETKILISKDNWKLEVTGNVKNPRSFSYQEITEMGNLTKDVLLICPGFFSQHGRWRGVSLNQLFELTGVGDSAKWAQFEGEPEGGSSSKKSYSIEEAREEKVFLAFEVNGAPLPVKHGFPLRVVAEDHFGGDWVKYVTRITVT